MRARELFFTPDDLKQYIFESYDSFRKSGYHKNAVFNGMPYKFPVHYGNMFVEDWKLAALKESFDLDAFKLRRQEAKIFSNRIKDLDQRSQVVIAVGHKISMFSVAVIPGDDITHKSRIETMGFVTPKEIAHVYLGENNKIDLIEFIDGTQFPESIELTNVEGINLTTTIFFADLESASKAHTNLWFLISALEGKGWILESRLNEALTEDSVTDKYIMKIPSLRWQKVTRNVWNTIQDEGLDEEQDEYSPNNWLMANLQISDIDAEQLRALDANTIDMFNLFDITLKERYPGLVDLIDYDAGTITIVKVMK